MIQRLRYKIRDIITVLKSHYVIISVGRKDLLNLVTENECDMKMNYMGLQPYAAVLMIKIASEFWDADDLALLKATLEAEVELTQNK